MQVSKWGWRDWAAMAWCGLLGAAALVAIGPGWGKAWPWLSDNSSNIASWVQAVGSIAAIVAGFRVARFSIEEQHSRQAAKEAEAERQRLRKQYILLGDRMAQAEAWTRSALDSSEHIVSLWKVQESGLVGVLRELNSLNADDFPDPLILFGITRLKIDLNQIEFLFRFPSAREAKTRLAFDLIEAINNVRAELTYQMRLVRHRLGGVSTEAEMLEIAQFGEQLERGGSE